VLQLLDQATPLLHDVESLSLPNSPSQT
jgi:hypothetical protein